MGVEEGLECTIFSPNLKKYSLILAIFHLCSVNYQIAPKYEIHFLCLRMNISMSFVQIGSLFIEKYCRQKATDGLLDQHTYRICWYPAKLTKLSVGGYNKPCPHEL